MENILLVTDGAWKGKTSMKAGSGIVLYNKTTKAQHNFMFSLDNYSFSNITFSTINPMIPEGTYRIELVNKTDESVEYKIDNYIKFKIDIGDDIYPPTNNRAEYLAYIFGNIICSVIYPNELITLVSDSKLLINTITVWMDNWVDKGLIKTKKNPDLLEIINLLPKPYKCEHINSHLKPYEYAKLNDVKKQFSLLNEEADVLANNAII